ncbi:MAG: LytR C-terminal domain-containing protein, partial [SAR324 cluster bacterium]|nr:LytR C-terminal domain-containing protein [SAR324 cluster bacterium]
LSIFPATLSLSANSGHMLDRFELLADKSSPFLTFKGFFDPEQFVKIKITQGSSETETTVILPNTFINNILLPQREITSFDVDGILKKMRLVEKITKTEKGEINFLVTVTVSSKEKHLLVLDTKRSDSRQLTFALQKKQKKVVSTVSSHGLQIPPTVKNELGPPKITPRERLLLHPVTALMSYRQFDQLNVAVLNASPNPGAAQRFAVMLDRMQKRTIEKRMGMKLNIVNISSVNEQTILPKTKIYFHANLLKAALILADVLPGEQILEPVPDNRISELANDVEIYVGKNVE